MLQEPLLPSSRRRFLKQFGTVGLVSSLPFSRNLWSLEIAGSGHSLSQKKYSLPVKNRAPLAASAFYFLPLGTVRPRGWLLNQLRIQANGLGGHLEETWPDVGPNSGWLGGKGESWERGPYYLDGLLPLAYLLDDAQLKAKAQKFIDWTLDHQAANGMIGPSTNNDWWPRMVMLKVLTQYYEVSGDQRVIPVMERYFAHQLQSLPKRSLVSWGKFRWQDNLLSVLWLYNRTGSADLLNLAHLLQQQGFDWVASFNDFKFTQRSLPIPQEQGESDMALASHGVNNGQAIKVGPLWSVVSGEQSDRSSALRMIEELDRYHGLPNGMFSCDEHLAGRDPSQGSELCTVVEFMYSLEHSLAISGDPLLGDRLEMLAYNALPAAFTDDMWAHQYNQEPNQVECSLHHKPWVSDGPESNLFGLEPNFGCCTANFHQGWPKFTSSLFMLSGAQDGTAEDGLVVPLYAPCEVNTFLRNTPVHIVEEADYPFRSTVSLRVEPASEVAFPLQLRIPAWAVGTIIKVNGHIQPTPAANSFANICRTWRAGDVVQIEFPMKPRISSGFNKSISVERGPLIFSYGIGEDWLKLRDRGLTADWQVYPTTQWNYALKVDSANLSDLVSVVETPLTASPFGSKHTPVRLKVKARKVEKWLATDGVADPVPQSPTADDQPEEGITLIPYAAAKLRITAFPQCKT